MIDRETLLAKWLILCGITILIAASCEEKERPEPSPLYGTWNLTKSTCYFGSSIENPDSIAWIPAGDEYSAVFEFEEDGTGHFTETEYSISVTTPATSTSNTITLTMTVDSQTYSVTLEYTISGSKLTTILHIPANPGLDSPEMWIVNEFVQE